MDEPSEGLAPTIIEMLIETFRKLEQEGLRILLIEQNLGVATSLAERQLVMVGGEIAAETTATADRRRPGAPAPLPRRRAGRALTMRPRGRRRRAGGAARAGCGGLVRAEGPARARLRQRQGRRLRDLRRRRRRQAHLPADRRSRPIPRRPRACSSRSSRPGRPTAARSRSSVEPRRPDAHLRHERRRHRHAAGDEHAAQTTSTRPGRPTAAGSSSPAKVRSSGCATSGGAARRVGTGFGAAADPAYSPRREADRLRLPAARVLDPEIYVMNADGTGVRQVTEPPRRQRGPRRGRRTARRLAFQSNAGGGQNEIYTVPLAGGTPKRVTTLRRSTRSSPTGRRTGAASRSPGTARSVTIANGKETQLTSGEDNDSAPAWRPVQPQ